ncbi:MAG: hypothetical protein AAFU38_05580, partial [Bacteroidota bacterium]
MLSLGPTASAQLVQGFVENQGQWPAEVLYLAQLPGHDVWVTQDALVYDFYEVEQERPSTRVSPAGEDAPVPQRRRGHVVEVWFSDGPDTERRAAQPMSVTAGTPRSTRLNYFLGNEASRRATSVRVVDTVTLEAVSPGVDAEIRLD